MSKLFRTVSLVMFAAVIAAWSAPMLRAADAPEGGKGKIKGVVYDADHKPVSGVDVRLFAEGEHPTTAPAASARSTAPSKLDDTPPAHKHQKPIAETKTDANGAFTFSDVAAGKYLVSAGSKEVGHAKGGATVTAGATVTLELTLKVKKPA